jgi:hypothetical protein
MVTLRKIQKYWTEVKRIVKGEVKQSCCCCKCPGDTAKKCADASGNKTKCRCDCHKK